MPLLKLLRKVNLNQNGAIPLLVLIAVVGALAFLAISGTAPFKEGLFGSLYPKPASKAATTFLETFDGLPAAPLPFTSPNWDLTVHSQGGGTWDFLTPMDADHGPDCSAPPATHPTTAYQDAVFNCKNHVMTALEGSYGLIYLTPNHMVDFSSSEGVVSFDVSTDRKSDRDYWDLWISPFNEHLQLALDTDQVDLDGYPRNAIRVVMWNTYGGENLCIDDVRNHQATRLHCTDGPVTSKVTRSATVRSKFELRISNNHVKFCIKTPTASQPEFCWVDQAISPLSWSRGVVQIGHHSYNPTKGCQPSCIGTAVPNTWHWDNVSISPAVPFTMIKSDRRYVDPLTTNTMNFASPAPANAFLRFAGSGSSIDLSIDGGVTWTKATKALVNPATIKGGFASYWHAIPQGTTSVRFRGQNTGTTWRIRDASIWSDNQPPSTPLPSVTPPPSGSPSPAASPSSSPTPIPSPSKTPTPSASTAPSCPAAGGNLLQNNGLECAGSGWQSTANGGRSIVSTPVHTGTKSQQMLASSAYPRQIIQSVPVTSGRSYALSGWINTNGIGGPGASVKVNWLSGTGAILSTGTTSPLTGSNNWTQQSAVLTAPANAVSARVTPFLAVEPDNTGTAWFDDISLTVSVQ